MPASAGGAGSFRPTWKTALIIAATAIAVAVAAVLVTGVYLLHRLGSSAKPAAATATATGGPSATCAWQPARTSDHQPGDLREAGTPPPSVPTSGLVMMKITTNLGDIEIQADRAKAPCVVASLAHLAGAHFYDRTACHRLTTSEIYVLQCGDPTGTGQGGPTYAFTVASPTPTPSPATTPTAKPSCTPIPLPSGFELPSLPPLPGGDKTTVTIVPGSCFDDWIPPGATQLPVAPERPYLRGTVSIATDGYATAGSQFFFTLRDMRLTGDSPDFGVVTKGMGILDQVAAGGVESGGFTPSDGKPKVRLEIISVSMS